MMQWLCNTHHTHYGHDIKYETIRKPELSIGPFYVTLSNPTQPNGTTESSQTRTKEHNMLYSYTWQQIFYYA